MAVATGLVPVLWRTQAQVFDGAAPSEKITPPGYLQLLLSNGQPSRVSADIDNGTGHIRSVKVKYKRRPIAGTTATVDDCSIQAIDPTYEQTLPALSFRKKGHFISYDTLRNMEEEATRTVMVGRPAPPMGILMEQYNELIRAGAALCVDINADLLTLQAANFGKNVTTGLNTAKTLNFPLSTATNPLTQGMTLLEADVMENEVQPGNIKIAGSGLINNVYVQNRFNTQNTRDQNYPNNFPQFFWDPAATSKWGANHFGVFENQAVQFININKFNGFVGGDKLSTWLFTLTLPLVDSFGGTQLQGIKFDAQLRHIDCPQTLEIAGEDTAVGRGWVIDLMCNYTQFNLPTDAYETTDRLTGNNGTYRYVATNA